MTAYDSERLFRAGLHALRTGRNKLALTCFSEAMRAETLSNTLRPNMRYLSYYGLSSALTHGATRETIEICERAAKTDGFEPQLQYNLGRVYALATKTTQALAAFEKGLRMDGHNSQVRAEIARLDRRGKPTFPFLGRDHALNRSLGKLRSSIRRPSGRKDTPYV